MGTMTAEELEKLQAELNELETVRRREIAARIKTAREWGDLKENAEYHAAKEDQAHLETRILKLRDQVRGATVVEAVATSDVVRHGSTVGYADQKTGRQQTFTIVSPHDAKPGQGLLSVASPVAQALIGKRVGDVAEFEAPNGTRRLLVESIS